MHAQNKKPAQPEAVPVFTSYDQFPSGVLAALESLHAVGVVQDAFTQAQVFRRDPQQFVIGQEFQALLQAQFRGVTRRSASSEPEARMLVSCFFLQTLTDISSLLGQTPITMPSYTGVPAPMNRVPRSWALNRP